MFRKALHLSASAALSAIPLAFLALPVAAESSDWTIDTPHAAASFSVKHMMLSNVSGSFGKITGTVKYDGKHLDKASVEATVDATSVNTRDEHRDEHLKSPDFFDTAKYPTITFKSTKIEPGKDGFKIAGDLTIHGVTKSVVLNAEPLSAPVKAHGSLHIGTSATTTVNRKDFGLNFNKTLDNGGAIVGDSVKITLDIEIKQKLDEAGEKAAPSNKS